MPASTTISAVGAPAAPNWCTRSVSIRPGSSSYKNSHGNHQVAFDDGSWGVEVASAVTSTRFEERDGSVVFTTILCDLDGTLVDSGRDIAEAFQLAVRLTTGKEGPAWQDITRHIGKPLAIMAQDLGVALSAQQLPLFLERYRRHYATHNARHTRPYAGVKETLLKLPCSIGVVTTKQQDQAESVLQRLALAAYVHHIQGMTPGLRAKPAPDQLQLALEALQCPPQQALMVGDTAADIQAGQAAGVRTCAVTYGFGKPEVLKALDPDYCIDRFPDLLHIIAL